MNKYCGFVYLVSCAGIAYVVKNKHLDEFVALHHGHGVIIVNDFVMSQIDFVNALQWYKTV